MDLRDYLKAPYPHYIEKVSSIIIEINKGVPGGIFLMNYEMLCRKFSEGTKRESLSSLYFIFAGSMSGIEDIMMIQRIYILDCMFSI
jgi:hypothetical protein